MLLPYVCSTVNLLLNKKLAKKTVLQFEKELQLNTYFELQLNTKLNTLKLKFEKEIKYFEL